VGEEIGALPGVRLLGSVLDGRPGVFARDETKIVLDVTRLGITGFQAADWLYEQRRVAPEAHDVHHLTFVITVADDDSTAEARGRDARPGRRRAGARGRPAAAAPAGVGTGGRLRHDAPRGLPRDPARPGWWSRA
jgi:hypothetical protein